jgi:hypothetical protein
VECGCAAQSGACSGRVGDGSWAADLEGGEGGAGAPQPQALNVRQVAHLRHAGGGAVDEAGAWQEALQLQNAAGHLAGCLLLARHVVLGCGGGTTWGHNVGDVRSDGVCCCSACLGGWGGQRPATPPAFVFGQSCRSSRASRDPSPKAHAPGGAHPCGTRPARWVRQRRARPASPPPAAGGSAPSRRSPEWSRCWGHRAQGGRRRGFRTRKRALAGQTGVQHPLVPEGRRGRRAARQQGGSDAASSPAAGSQEEAALLRRVGGTVKCLRILDDLYV